MTSRGIPPLQQVRLGNGMLGKTERPSCVCVCVCVFITWSVFGASLYSMCAVGHENTVTQERRSVCVCVCVCVLPAQSVCKVLSGGGRPRALVNETDCWLSAILRRKTARRKRCFRSSIAANVPLSKAPKQELQLTVTLRDGLIRRFRKKIRNAHPECPSMKNRFLSQ